MRITVQPRLLHDQLCESLAEWLHKQRVKGLWWHTPNTSSSPQYNAKLKRLGRLPGVFDYQFLDATAVSAFIEVKRKGDYLNENQCIFKAWLDERAIRNAVITTDDPAVLIGETQRILRTWGFLHSQ